MFRLERFFTESVQAPAEKTGSYQGHSAPRSKGNKPKRGGKREMAAGGGSVMEEELRAVMSTSEIAPVELSAEEITAAETEAPEVSVSEETEPEAEKAQVAVADLEKELGGSTDDTASQAFETPKEEKVEKKLEQKPKEKTVSPVGKAAQREGWDDYEKEKRESGKVRVAPVEAYNQKTQERFSEIRDNIAWFKEQTTADFIEEQPEYVSLMKSLRKVEPLLSGAWEEDEQVAAHLIAIEKKRIEDAFTSLTHKVEEQHAGVEEYFGDAQLQELLASTMSGVQVEMKEEEKLKRSGWWNKDEQKAEEVSRDLVSNPKEQSAEDEKMSDDDPELSPEVIQVGDEVRKAVEKLDTDMSSLADRSPKVKEDQAFETASRQLEKLRKYVASDESLEKHSAIIEASLKVLQSTVEDLKKETGLNSKQQESAVFSELNPEDADLPVQEQYAELEQQALHFVDVNPEIESTDAYRNFIKSLDALKATEANRPDSPETATDSLLKLRLKNVNEKLATLRSEAGSIEKQTKSQASNAELAQDDPAGLFAYGEELAAQKKQPEDEKEPAGEEDLLPNYKRQEWEILERSDWEKVARMKRDEAKQRETEKVLNRTSEQQGNENEILGAVESEVSTEGDEAVISKKEGEARASTMERPQLFGMTIPAAGADARFAARAFQKGLLLERGRLEGKRVGVKLLQQIDDVLRVVGYVPDSGLREEDVTKLNQLVSEINQPERSGSRGLDQLDQMKAELDQKVTERLPALSGMPGYKKSYIQIAKGVMRRVLSKNKS